LALKAERNIGEVSTVSARALMGASFPVDHPGRRPHWAIRPSMWSLTLLTIGEDCVGARLYEAASCASRRTGKTPWARRSWISFQVNLWVALPHMMRKAMRATTQPRFVQKAGLRRVSRTHAAGI